VRIENLDIDRIKINSFTRVRGNRIGVEQAALLLVMVDTTQRRNGCQFAALIERRSRRGGWAYFVWLLVYSLTAMMFAGEMEFHVGANTIQLSALLVPILIVVVQLIRPTILGWIVIFSPTFLYFCVGVFYFVGNNLGSRPQWQDDLEGVVLGSLFLVALLGACMALSFAAKPGALSAREQMPDGGPRFENQS